MASKTRAQLRDLVRAQVDMDDVELPNSLLDPWLEDGFERMLAVEERWPFLEYDWEFTTLASQVAYPKAAIAAADANGYEIDKITDVMDFTDFEPVEMLHLSHSRALRIYGHGLGGSGVPSHWSEWGGAINLWSAPEAGRLVVVTGYRKPKWGVGDATVVDADARLHMALYFFASAMAYAQQEDEVLSSQYMKQFESAVSQAHRTIMAEVQRQPIILSGRSL